MLKLKAVILTVGLMSPIIVHSMLFDLQSGIAKCITEDLMSNAMTIGKYSVVNPNKGYPLPDTHKITVRVTSPAGNNHYYCDGVDSGTFAFTANEAGDYMACFWSQEHKPPLTMSVELDWQSGVAAKDWSKVARKGQIDEMEIELKKLYDTITTIHDEMFYLREREGEMQKLNTATNSKMAAFSFVSILVCLSVAGLQLWYLKTFFERKKML
ncbi:hypothetical protein NMG60_11006426 [Bertholletia excelsa]